MAIRSIALPRTVLAALAIVIAITGVSIVLADPTSPVTISDVDTPDPVASGAQITHSITIVNTGGAKITNVVMSDQLNGVGGIGVPPQLQIASSRGSCAQSGTLVTCNAGTIEGNGTWVISIRGIVTASNGTVLNNTVSVTGTKSAQNFTTTNTTTTLVSNGGGSNLPELSINKTGPTSVVVSSPMTYTLTVNNTGTQNATSVKVIDTVPAGLTGITASGTSLFVCGVAGQTVTCDGGAVNQGSNATITINATAPAILGSITNTAVVDPDNTIAESNELNNTSALVNTQVTDLPEPPALSINITDDPTVITGAGPFDPVVPGAGLTYKILVTNNAATRADDVVIVLGTQNLEASSVIVSQIITNGTEGNSGGCANVAPQAKCITRTLNPGGTILMTVSGYVIGSAGSYMIGTATVTGNIKNKGVTNTDTELTTVMPEFDLTITKADSPDPVCAASWPGPGYPAGPGAPLGPDYPASNTCQGGLTYTFVVGNSGLQTASGVTVRDPLPAGAIYVAGSTVNLDGGGFTCGYDVPTNVVTCTGGTIPGQSTRTFKFIVVAPAGLGQITNTVTVDPNNAIFEADESNNMFTQTTQVATGIDLTVSKHSNHETNFVATRGTLTYTIKVSNVGTQDSTNILVRDALPADTIFRDAVSDPLHGFTCSQAGGIVDCMNGHIQGTESMNFPNLAGTAVDTATITIRVFATAYEQAAMHNEVRVDPLNQIGEANENNNLAVQNTQVKSGGTTNDAFNELTISKIQQSPLPANNTARNAVVTYIVKVGNDGTDPVVGVKVRDTLPAGARYIQATGTNSFLCQQQLIGFVDCVGGQIPANTPTALGATITIKAFAPDTPGEYTNQVEVDPDHTIAEGDEFNNNAHSDMTVTNGGVGSFHELSVTKNQMSPVKTNTARNAVVTYSIVVTNNGSDAVNGVLVRDKLPAGARYIQATGNHQFLCTEAQTGIVDCVNGQVAGGGGTSTIELKMFAPDTPGVYTNQVNVDPDNAIPEGDEFNNQATEDTTVVNGGTGSFNDLGLGFKLAPDSTNATTPLGAITYRLDVFNYGTDAAMNVAVRDILPAGVTFVSAGDAAPGPGAFTCSESEGVIDCIGATIPGTGVGAPPPFPPGQRTIVINVTAPNQLGVLTNSAVADPDATIPEGDETNNSAVFLTTVGSVINLHIEKNGPEESSQGSPGEYDIVMTNQSQGGTGQTAYRVKMVDPLPVGLIPLATDAGDGNNWACSIGENPINVVECVGDLEPDVPVTIKVFVFMTADSQPFDNEACFVPNPDVPPGIPSMVTEYVPPGTSDNCSTATTTATPPPTFPDLVVTKTGSPSQAAPGENVTYTILVNNNGTAKAMSPVTLTDNLPTGSVEFLSALGTNGWTCTGTGPVVCHDGGGLGLDVGASTTITIQAKVKPTTTLPFVNQAVASAATHDPADPAAIDESPGQPNNTATATTSVSGSGSDLALTTILDSPDPVAPGQGLKYTVIAVNGGSTSADGVHISIALPTSGTTFVSAAGTNGFDCTGGPGGPLDCTGDLPAGDSTVITVSLTVNVGAPPPDDLHLTATIDPGHVFSETDEGNNTQTETTTISGTSCSLCIDLVSAQLVPSVDPIASGEDLTLTYQVVNVGDMDTSTQIHPTDEILLQLIANIDGSTGGFTPSAPVSNNPNVTCTQFDFFGLVLVNQCKGHLSPGEGVTITFTMNNVTGSSIFVEGKADPNGEATEFIETNNKLSQTIKINP